MSDAQPMEPNASPPDTPQTPDTAPSGDGAAAPEPTAPDADEPAAALAEPIDGHTAADQAIPGEPPYRLPQAVVPQHARVGAEHG